MGLFDKLKDALFEEVEEEVEEKPVEPKKEVIGDKGSFKDKLLSRQKKKEKKDKEVIAQKVLLEENKIDDRVDHHVLRDEDFEIEPDNREEDMVLERPINNNGSFTVIEDSDLVDDDYIPEEPQIIDVIPKTEEVEETEYSYYEEKEEPKEEKIYDNPAKSYDHLYGMDDDKIEINGYGNSYSYRNEKTTFKPSPIISPIYGILDKNYKKEDIVQKREIRLTSEYERRNLTVDDVRKKAYGTLSDDLIDDMDKGLEEVSNNVQKEEDNLLIDLSSDISKPQVKEVTVGDAEEYYDDLGLEYNVDYKDGAVEASKETVVNEDVSKEVSEDIPEAKEVIDNITSKEEKSPNDIHIEKNDTEDDDNLFDLIDSMYQEKE
ncbi:MAG: hypothetical protein IKE89_03085 [Bacilli bacterium]|nr:hypothetical protein [Bacilli bacterium]